MLNYFKALILSYKNTPLAIRELMTINELESHQFINQLKLLPEISDILVLSTCNRTEVYYAAPTDYSEVIVLEILKLKKIGLNEGYQQYFQPILNHQEAVQHLFEVATGLDSQVVGDLQIPNQVKTAYQSSADLNVAGPFLHRLLHSIFFTNKKIVQETPFRSGVASTSYASTELIETFAKNLVNPKVLILGVGEIGADVCRNLKDSFIKDITLINRTFEKTQALAEECHFEALPFEKLEEQVLEADIIVCSIASESPMISKELLAQKPLLSFKYLIDLAVPRSIEANVEEISGVLLYNIDQINLTVSEALNKRLAAIPDVKSIITNAIEEFNDWTREMEISPTLQKLKNALEQIRQEELARFAKKLNEIEMQRIEQITKNMMQKIIKLPALQLKAACKRGEAETLIDVLNDLFDLEKRSIQIK